MVTFYLHVPFIIDRTGGLLLTYAVIGFGRLPPLRDAVDRDDDVSSLQLAHCFMGFLPDGPALRTPRASCGVVRKFPPGGLFPA